MPEPKITFGPEYRPQPSQSALDLTVVAEELRKTFALGFDKGVEFYKVVVQPPPAPPPQDKGVLSRLQTDEDDFGSNVLDMDTIYNLSPEGQEALLARHGLSWRGPDMPPADPVEKEISELTGQPRPQEESEE